MDNIFLYAIIALLVILIIFVLILLLRRPKAAPPAKTDDTALLEEVRSQFRTLNTLSLSALSQVSSNTREELSGMRESLSTQLNSLFSSVGELKSVSKDISELKTALAGNKTRGNWGEARLASILADNLAPSQYISQCSLGSSERVDFAVSLPGDTDVLLPIDSKFPLETFSAYVETGDALPLKRAVTEQAKSIAKKYILPPRTTDFAIMFLPSESLYLALAEIDMPAILAREYRVILAGPSVLSAMLSGVSLILGAYTLNSRTDDILAAFQETAQSLAGIESELLLAQKSVSAADGHISKALRSTKKLTLRLEETERL